MIIYFIGSKLDGEICLMISEEIMICDALRDFVPFVQFKKSEEHPWRIVTFSKVAGFRPATLLKKRVFL